MTCIGAICLGLSLRIHPILLIRCAVCLHFRHTLHLIRNHHQLSGYGTRAVQLVGAHRVELWTSCLSSKRSNQLSYAPPLNPSATSRPRSLNGQGPLRAFAEAQYYSSADSFTSSGKELAERRSCFAAHRLPLHKLRALEAKETNHLLWDGTDDAALEPIMPKARRATELTDPAGRSAVNCLRSSFLSWDKFRGRR